MARPKFKKMIEGRGGWCDWVYPVAKPPQKNHLMKCCDCGLVHEMQFQAFAEHNQKRGKFTATILPWPIRVMFRARRTRKRSE